MRCATVLLSLTLTVLFTAHIDAQPLSRGAMETDTTTMMADRGMMAGRHMMMRSNMKRGGVTACDTCFPCGTGGKAAMHRGMAGCEMRPYMDLIYRLPDFKNQLDLSPDQISRLKDLQSTFLKNKADWMAEIEKKRIDLDNQLERRADASAVRRTLESVSKIVVDMKVSGYETAREMMTVLNPEQKQRWRDFCSSCRPDIMQ